MKLSRTHKIVFAWLAGAGLSSCVSYEPAVLVPEIALSPEQINLGNDSSSQQVLDFGVEVTLNESDSLFNVEVLPGVRVRAVTPGGAAETASIQVGDVILRIDDLAINQPDTLRALEQTPAESRQFEFQLRRDTTVFATTVNARAVAANAAPRELYRVDPVASRAGYATTLVNTDGGELAAARVMEIFPGSPLPAAGIARNDLILSVNGAALNSAQDLVTRLNRDFDLGARVEFTIYRDGNLQVLPVRLWDPGRRISRIALGPLLQYESSLSPESRRLSILDLWLFSLYSYRQNEGERSHSLLGLFNFTSDYGELVEE